MRPLRTLAPRPVQVAFLSATLASLAACGDPDQDAEPTNVRMVRLDRDFVPGDPTFRRDPALNVETTSAAGGTASHNMGENCLRCHQAKGPGPGLFTMAGTFYKADGTPYPNAVLKLYARAEAPGGGPVQFGGPAVLTEEIMTIPVDARGNFYTTRALPASYPNRAVYPRFFGPNGEELMQPNGMAPAQMAGGVHTGGCNHCHGLGFRMVGVLPM